MLNPVPFQLNADGGRLYIGVLTLDSQDRRVLDDLGLAARQPEAPQRHGPRLHWARLQEAIRYVANAFRTDRILPSS